MKQNSIRVVACMRPRRQHDTNPRCIRVEGTTLILTSPDNNQPNRFVFDHCPQPPPHHELDSSDRFVFERNTHQRAVYLNYGVDLLAHALDDHNACLFTYGVSNSGQSETLFGNRHCKGLVEQFIEELMWTIDSEQHKVSLEILCISNEQIIDCLEDKSF